MSLLGGLELDAPIDPDDPNSGTVSTQMKNTQPAPGPFSSLALLPLPPDPPPSIHPVIFLRVLMPPVLDQRLYTPLELVAHPAWVDASNAFNSLNHKSACTSVFYVLLCQLF